MQRATRSLDLTRSTDSTETLRILKVIPRTHETEEEALAAAAARSFLPLGLTADRAADLGWAEIALIEEVRGRGAGARFYDRRLFLFYFFVLCSAHVPPGASWW